jgi:hypothetical protein
MDLKGVLEALPERRERILATVAGVVMRMVNKAVTGLPFVHVRGWAGVKSGCPAVGGGHCHWAWDYVSIIVVNCVIITLVIIMIIIIITTTHPAISGVTGAGVGVLHVRGAQADQ